MRLITSEIGFRIESGMIDVSNYADNCYPRLRFRRANLDSLADSITVRPVTLCHLLVDDHHVGLATAIATIKLASLQERNAHRAKIVWQDAAIANARRLARIEGATFNRQLTVWIT